MFVLHNNKKDIFVSIAGYNEKFIKNTIDDALEKASDPDNVNFGVFNQASSKDSLADLSACPNTRHVDVIHPQPLGVGIARLNASLLHQGEKYFCQIDAHNFFVPGWDQILIHDLEQVRSIAEKPILAQSVVWHTVDAYDNDEYRKTLERQEVFPLTVNEMGDTVPDTTRTEESKMMGKFQEHFFIMACAEFFTDSSFIYDVSYNPHVMYLPDQELTAVRACTRGYRIFSSGQSTMSTLGKHSERFSQEAFGDDFQYEFTAETQASFYRAGTVPYYSYMMGMNCGFYGVPDESDYEDFVKRSGIDFRYLKRQEIVDALDPETPETYVSKPIK